MPLWLVIGGIASGKSIWAEQFIEDKLKHDEVEYIATVDESLISPDDWTWHEKIKEHRRRRPKSWTVWHDADNPIRRILTLPPTHSVLWDGVGPYISRYLSRPERSERLGGNKSHNSQDTGNLVHSPNENWEERLFDISRRQADTVIVSEETGMGLMPIDPDMYDFVHTLGKFNQIASHYATGVIFIVAGIPLWIKGGPQ